MKHEYFFCTMNTHEQSITGFSLIEVMVALAIFSALSLSAVSLLSGIQRAQLHVGAVNNVETEGNYALSQITQSVRNASAITAPVSTATSSSLTLTLSALPAENPTIMNLSGTTIVSKKGSAAAIALTSPTVQVTKLTFTNLTGTGSKGSVRIALTLINTNPGGRSERTFSRTYYTTVSLR